MAKEKITWDAAADQKLFLVILAIHEIKVDFEAVARSFDCTPRAIQERIKRIKLMAKNEGVSSADSTPSKPPKATVKDTGNMKIKINTKAKAPGEGVHTRKKRKTDNGGSVAVDTSKKEITLAALREMDDMPVLEDDSDDAVVKKEPFDFDADFDADADLSGISAFDPAEDQLLAEQDFLHNAN
ncbi:MAG: hypothetical protein HETSPECPRED_006635 [Heterodermia speciosa]|uniref:Uncharacterized protein n=1 Tax=Heterodermia speciosa TaxID=116794 RepID=A0A8H3IUW7_9LECA|nr:MAG: hypothetical protein HETSPECPRED_006635 [Heterodermia speciosa]